MAPNKSNPPSSPTTITNLATNLVTVKLNIDNFLLWKAQILPFLKGHRLYGYIDGTISPPPPTVDGKPNLAYTDWALQDQLILSAINSSLTNNVLAQVLECTTSREVWNTLSSLFSAQSSAHIMQTQFQLATLKKGSETISEYFHKATALSSSLSVAGRPLSPSEFIIYLLAGLGSEYESIVTSITTRPDTLSSAQVFSYLLNH